MFSYFKRDCGGGSKADGKAELARGLGFHKSTIIFDCLFLLLDFRSGICRRNVTGSREKLRPLRKLRLVPKYSETHANISVRM